MKHVIKATGEFPEISISCNRATRKSVRWQSKDYCWQYTVNVTVDGKRSYFLFHDSIYSLEQESKGLINGTHFTETEKYAELIANVKTTEMNGVPCPTKTVTYADVMEQDRAWHIGAFWCFVYDASAYYNTYNFDEFRAEFGYGLDKIDEAIKVYNACKATSDKCEKLFGVSDAKYIVGELMNYLVANEGC